jgi:hypothetical protein
MVKFTKGNSYLPKGTWSFNLPSGWSCPHAKACLAFADRATGKIVNGKEQEFRCYSATVERYPAVRKQVWDNFDSLKRLNHGEIVRMLLEALPHKATHVRIHGGGDFFSQNYFDAWLEVCRKRPNVQFWAFTKSLPFWVARIEEIPINLALTASVGGRHDHLIEKYGLRYAVVVNSEDEANMMGLPVDMNDFHAMRRGGSFALVENSKRSKFPPQT